MCILSEPKIDVIRYVAYASSISLHTSGSSFPYLLQVLPYHIFAEIYRDDKGLCFSSHDNSREEYFWKQSVFPGCNPFIFSEIRRKKRWSMVFSVFSVHFSVAYYFMRKTSKMSEIGLKALCLRCGFQT